MKDEMISTHMYHASIFPVPVFFMLCLPYIVSLRGGGKRYHPSPPPPPPPPPSPPS